MIAARALAAAFAFAALALGQDSRPASRPAPADAPKDPPAVEVRGDEVVRGADPALPRADEKVDFTRHVLPILERSCFECHQATRRDASGRLRKARGGLRLDGKAYFRRGGDGGEPFVAGDAEASELWIRVTLEPDDEDLMPGGDYEPLPGVEQQVLKRWIDEGASFGGWVGMAAKEMPAERGPVATNPRIAHFERISGQLRPVGAGAIRKVVDATGDKARIVSLWPESPLLRVEWFAHEEDVGDDDVAALAPLAEHIAVLKLARTKVTDRGLRPLTRMARLSDLDLRGTGIGDGGLTHLSDLPSLRSINLVDTEVGDAGVLQLAKITSLRDVYLWNSGASPRAIAGLRVALKDATVRGAPEFPAPPTPVPDGPGGRRR